MKKKGGKKLSQPGPVAQGGQFTKELTPDGLFNADKADTNGKQKKGPSGAVL